MSSRRFRIEFVPTAWHEVGALSSDEFRRLQRALAELAERNTVVAAPKGVIDLGRLAANYAVDPTSETVTLLQVAGSVSRPDQAADAVPLTSLTPGV